jgi:hypothetical protein
MLAAAAVALGVLHVVGAGDPQAVHTVRALVYDPAHGALVRMDLPGWFVRAISVGGQRRILVWTE